MKDVAKGATHKEQLRKARHETSATCSERDEAVAGRLAALAEAEAFRARCDRAVEELEVARAKADQFWLEVEAARTELAKLRVEVGEARLHREEALACAEKLRRELESSLAETWELRRELDSTGAAAEETRCKGGCVAAEVEEAAIKAGAERDEAAEDLLVAGKTWCGNSGVAYEFLQGQLDYLTQWVVARERRIRCVAESMQEAWAAGRWDATGGIPGRKRRRRGSEAELDALADFVAECVNILSELAEIPLVERRAEDESESEGADPQADSRGTSRSPSGEEATA